MSEFQRLIRFEDESGNVIYGDLNEELPAAQIVGKTVSVLDGHVQSGFTKTDKKATVKKLLSPLPKAHAIICVGLNYAHHAKEANLTVPPYPVIFTKPPDALAGPLDEVPVHPSAQEMLDYEGELTIIIGKDAKNVSEADALNYILGYTSGNDVSARNFQLPEVSGGQFCYAKSFDAFAPIGPAIVHPSLVPDPQGLKLWTKVNGEVRQESGTNDMIWSVAKIVEHVTRGTTVRKGTVVMTGTPSGVGLFMSPKGFIKDGDEVEVGIEGVGSISNKIRFE
ncbi:hypothetical protein M501DRAFT_136675 [Patellaria atrata CBS 101060]|uniref:Fumarylacetoacetase-like C-terminal domain-containing protein n=1 Tax=Patellaria atrata CBS 101060 TaxID=1346257 RepID=A0A9P4VLN1_9PEZI|nr:hypothetical protein M501DRAFT_136675 [Patellaria atrata CBS 101060]